jgi:hypothetical protein
MSKEKFKSVTLTPRVTGARVAITDKERTKQVVRWSVASDMQENYSLAFAHKLLARYIYTYAATSFLWQHHRYSHIISCDVTGPEFSINKLLLLLCHLPLGEMPSCDFSS